MVAKYLVRTVEDPSDDEACEQMILARRMRVSDSAMPASIFPRHVVPGVGTYQESPRAVYPSDHALVPHGFSVILNAPAVFFRFTAVASPRRHLKAADAWGADVSGAKDADAVSILADRIAWFMERLGVPNGLHAVGYTSSDIPALVAGTLPQHRVTTLSPRVAIDRHRPSRGRTKVMTKSNARISPADASVPHHPLMPNPLNTAGPR